MKSEMKERKPLTEEQRQKRKKAAAFALMGLAFTGVMWLILAPSSKDGKGDVGKGFNTEMPDADKASLTGDKRKAYAEEDLKRREQEKKKAMGTLGDFFGDGGVPQEAVSADETYDLAQAEQQPSPQERQEASTIRSSASAYRDLNATLGNFYERPVQDTEKEDLRKRLDELETAMTRQENTQPTMDDQVKLLEKSYELAAKYMPESQKPEGAVSSQEAVSSKIQGVSKGKKPKVTPVGQVSRSVVSSLSDPMGEAESVVSFAENRNTVFYTAVGTVTETDRNTIVACVHGTQTVTDGQSVRLRLLEEMLVGKRMVPRNTVLVGTARIEGERLGISLSSIEHGGMVIPVELSVYDRDGQSGIFIPNSQEVAALKEIGANAGSSLGGGISISTGTGAQLVSDLGKGVIQGVSQYITKKMRTAKVHLKAGYKVLLYQEEK